MHDEQNTIEKFNSSFYKYSIKNKKSKIILYGTGLITEYVLKNLRKDYNFIGVIDFNSDKIKICNVDIIPKNYLTSYDFDFVVVMNRNPVVTENIANRIHEAFPNLKLKSIDGSNIKIKKTKKINSFLSIEEIKKQIEKFSVISFDLFDTLILRKIPHPDFVKKIIGNYAEKEFEIKTFYNDRVIVEKKIENINQYYTIYDIYKFLNDYYGEVISQKLLEYEIKIESCILQARKDVLDLYNFALENHKKVYISSDMYLTKDIILTICKKNKIKISTENLLISSNIKKSKSDGSLYKFLKKINKGQKILHIGDNEYSDYIMAKKNKINAIIIQNAYNQIKDFSSKLKFNNNYELFASGLSLSYLFNSPFFEKIKDLEVFGYSIIGPLILNWLLWIISKIKQYENRYIFFAARDGYFTVQLFNYICNLLEINKVGVYLPISRTFLSYIDSFDEKGNFVKSCNFKGSEKELLEYRFGINDFSGDATIVKDFSYENSIKFSEDLIKKIREDIEYQKIRYHRILRINHFFDDKIALFVDPSYKGTTQNKLQKFSGIEIKGFYCYADLSDDNPYYKNSNMEAFFQNFDDKKAMQSILYKWHMLFESSIMVAPTGSFIKLKNDNDWLYTPLGKTQYEWYNKEKIFLGVFNYIKDVIDFHKLFDFKLEFEKNNPLEIFYSVVNKNLLFESVKKTFYMDSFYEDVHDLPVF